VCGTLVPRANAAGWADAQAARHSPTASGLKLEDVGRVTNPPHAHQVKKGSAKVGNARAEPCASPGENQSAKPHVIGLELPETARGRAKRQKPAEKPTCARSAPT